MPIATPLLILWDIDHTLVTITGVSRNIYALAFEAVTGQPLGELADMAGRTDEAIIRETLALNGIDSATSFDAFYKQLGEAARSLEGMMREHGQAMDGAAAAITSFAADGAVQSVVTGNIRSIAVTKLEAFGLDTHIDFEVGGYGDDGTDRAVLVRLAVERAERSYRAGFNPASAVVIGDTPHDVKGALDNGAFAVGVATGSSGAEELWAAGADLVLDDLQDVRQLRAAVQARQGR